MSRLLRMYPPAWRERYLEEFTELLDARPASLADRFDILRGALDAWIHPQVRRADHAPAPDRQPIAWSSLVPAIAGGILLIVGGVSIATSPFSAAFGYRESEAGTAAIVLGLIAIGLSALAIARSTPGGSPSSMKAAAVMLGGGLLMIAGWPLLIVGFLAHDVAALAFGLVAVRAGRHVLGVAIFVAGLILPSFNTEDGRALLVIPVGALWIVAGIVAARMRPATGVPSGPVPKPVATGPE